MSITLTSGNNTITIVAAAGAAVSPLPPETGNDGYALIEVSSTAAWRPILESYVVPLFAISTFATTTGTQETGASVVTPAFTATYNRTPTTQADLDDSDGNATKDVLSTPTSFSSDETFTETANNATVTFTLSGAIGAETDTSQSSIAWRPRTYWGVDLDGLSTEADIEGLSNSQLDSNRNTSFTLSPTTNEHIYYAYPASYGAATFTVGGFEGGFDLVDAAISVTNVNAVTQDYRLYKSTNPNLGSTTVVVT